MNFYILAFLLLFQLPFQHSSRLTARQPQPKKDRAATANIVFKSTDGGQTWQDISNGLPEPVQDDYGIGRNIFFADDNGVWLTDGNGIYHSKPNSTAPFWNKEIFPDEHASIAPGKNGIYAYNYAGGISQKISGTSVWSPVYTNFPYEKIRSVYETAGGSIFIGSDYGLFRSTNSGKTWKQVNSGGVLGNLVESNGVLLATSSSGIIRSTDGGENWALVISEGGVGIDVERIKDGFAAINYSTAANTRRIRTSYDGGKTWQPIDAGFPGQDIIESPMKPINTGMPAQLSADSVWHPKEVALPVFEYKTSIIQMGENFFCGHTDGIYKTSDKGKTWKLVLPAEKGKMFKLSVSGNVIYAMQMENHC